jgi:Lantibiotic dehydratase, C terminus.
MEDRFLAVRRWARDHGLPRFVFVRTPVEVKPYYLDFDSVHYIENFVRASRRTLEQRSPDTVISVVEMLPEPDRLWLADAQGRRYTSELRIVAVDPTR